MSPGKHMLAINGSYRDDGITDQVVDTALRTLEQSGANVESVLLRDYPIEFCLNCRACTQQTGAEPGQCVLNDGMHELVEKIEHADAFILAAPTNLGSVTALFRRFLERLIVYAYWPWGAHAPVYRKADQARKKALVISSCAAPGLLGRWLYSSDKQLKTAARMIGADSVGTLFPGMIADAPDRRLPDRVRRKAQEMAEKLL